MKYLIGIFLLGAFALIGPGCKKSKQDLTGHYLDGNWELRKTFGGLQMGGGYPPGNGNRLVFSGHDYQQYRNGQLTGSGRMELLKDTATGPCWGGANSGQTNKRILFDGDNSWKFINLTGNSLEIFWGCLATDGGLYEKYEKISN